MPPGGMLLRNLLRVVLYWRWPRMLALPGGQQLSPEQRGPLQDDGNNGGGDGEIGGGGDNNGGGGADDESSGTDNNGGDSNNNGGGADYNGGGAVPRDRAAHRRE
eukprot:17034-Rhodomonas_salina.1